MAEVPEMTEEQQSAMKEIKEKFVGNWKEYRHENVDEFFKEMGVNFFLRKLVGMSKPEMEIQVGDVDIKISVKLPGKTDVSNLQLGKEIENTNQQGLFLVTASYDDGKLVTNAKPSPNSKDPNGKSVEVTREINEEGDLIQTFNVNGVLCKRYFNKM
ncbi:fatty acid binding protein [Plakobranchus ocellatus]|uniref:Fatty acid binding protein n=1 Tax=Plakobranchus ocellatus TaxID=259542 RepID=A0AAV4DB62_9GAST|nr:fatty acid binding protein [Plakobranchus ocellatus]